MIKKLPISRIAIALVLLLTLQACTADAVTTELQVIGDAVSVALPIIANIPGVPPVVAAAITNYAIPYLASVNNATQAAINILNDKTMTPAQQAAAITAAFAATIAPNLPPGTPTVVINIIAVVAQDVAKFLSNLSVSKAKLTVTQMSKPVSLHFSKSKLDKVQKQVALNGIKLAGLR